MLPLRFLSASSTLLQLVRQGGGVAVRAFSNSLNSSILKQMKSSYARHEELSQRLEKSTDLPREEYIKMNHELSALYDKYDCYKKYMRVTKEIQEAKEMIAEESDKEMIKLAEEDLSRLLKEEESIIEEANHISLPSNLEDKKNCTLEVRAGAGGAEASLFTEDIFNMYKNYCALKDWKWSILSLNTSSGGGIKEAIVKITGEGSYGTLRTESGVHRVQRVPETESQGRIHTSTMTVAVFPEVENVDLLIRPEDLRIDVYRSSGKGGQHVNKTESAVRITHIPTGIVVANQDERSQHMNKAKAMQILAIRLQNRQDAMMNEEALTDRQIGSGERCEKNRTYNYPNSRITDHRIGLTLYGMDKMMNGELLDEFAGALKRWRIQKEFEALEG
ncbi:peptide chain release factor 1 [Blastocystis sp. ATCC 50177/Nand II]|uniref:Peptide chain release factor 1 n=1 Tax=Blastocystis sp. subtype 1 (strain ATCC 50177 / NandII) TaxID=478820 RepID=A0A196SIC5_BLAHN|nr:peptide chain release factor 1 [Blastocystis sp. ATCC 50177/Nand II]